MEIKQVIDSWNAIWSAARSSLKSGDEHDLLKIHGKVVADFISEQEKKMNEAKSEKTSNIEK